MQDRELSLAGHLIELRRRLVVAVAALIVGTVVAFVFHRMIFDVLMGPAQGFESLRDNKLIFTQATEMIGITMKVSLMGGLALVSPVILYQMVMFVAPGLTPREKRYLFALLPGTMIAFVAGATFGYLFLLPPAIGFLLTFGSDIATPMIRVGNYINLVVTLLFWLGVSFQDTPCHVLPEQGQDHYAQGNGAPATLCRRCRLHTRRADYAHLRPRQPDPCRGANSPLV